MSMNNLLTIALASIASSAAFTVAPSVSSSTNRVAVISLNEAKNGFGGGDDNHIGIQTRRDTLQSIIIGGAAVVVAGSAPNIAMAFPNKISNKYDDRPRQRGSKPRGLGVATRVDMTSQEYEGLKPCGAAPNCFCSTDNIEDSPDTNIPSFKPPKQSTSREDAFEQLYDVVKAYEPEQNGVDGGGFDIVTYDPKNGYMYVQFESLKNGFIDDVEFAILGDDNKENNIEVQVRSASRLGYLDFGVNAKRVNYIAKKLREKGWDAKGVEFDTHRGYADENGLTSF